MTPSTLEKVGLRSAWTARAARAAVATTTVAALGTGLLAAVADTGPSAGAASPGAVPAGLDSPAWVAGPFNDAGRPIALSSPNVASLPGGPAVVVGDGSGNVFAYNLATGNPVWITNIGAPVSSSPSVAGAGFGLDRVFVGSGDTFSPFGGGYQAIGPDGQPNWFVQETNPPGDPFATNGVQASMAVGNLQGGTDVVAGSLGEEEYAMDAGSGGVLPGFPWFQADSNFTTPAIADLYGNGTNEIVEGGDSTAGGSYGTFYQNGGHLRILSPTGNLGQPQPNDGLVCQYDTNETVQSSPAVGEFLGASSQVGIVFGTGATYHQSNTDQVLAVDTHCNLLWATTLDGATAPSSPALADVLGNGQLQVVEGTDNGSTGSLWALNGANGAPIWRTPVGRMIGSAVTVDLGGGYQDVLAPTVNGVYVLDGRSGAVLTVLQPNTGFQNSPLVTRDPNGTIGITIAGYQNAGSFIYHYELAGTDGGVVHENGAWPQFHHDGQLTGDAGTVQQIQFPCGPPPGGPNGYILSASDGGVFSFGNLPFCGSTGAITLNRPVVGAAETPNGGGYWEVATDGGIFAFGDAGFFGSLGATPLNAPIVAMAATPSGQGYWLVASDGGVFAFGDARFFGSMGGSPLNRPVVGMASTADGGGYWLVASDGGLFAFGDAQFLGSMGGSPLNRPVVAMARTPGGGGYWLVASDGGLFAFGDAGFFGSMGGQPLNQPVVGLEATPGGGYRMVATDGGIFSFGPGAPFYGSMGGQPLNRPVVAIAGF